MYRLMVTVILATVLAGTTARAEECPASQYEDMVLAARSADSGREWDKSVELYRKMLADCRSLLTGSDLVKAYDALAVGLLMQGNPSAAIDAAAKCLEQDAKYNACLMTAAQASYDLGDRERAVGFAREAVEIGGYDDYSNAVAIAAKDFLKKVGAK
jgi:tetratricopeptide (TPR) repeat protein